MRLENDRIGVEVEKKTGYRYQMTGRIKIVAAGTEVIPVYQVGEKFKMLSPDGVDEVEPTGNYYITAETINPYHIVLDIF